MRASLQKTGKATVVAIPRSLLKELRLNAGDKVEITVEGNSIVLMPVGRHPREGWAEHSKAIAQAGEGLVWDDPDNWAW
jgi:antitoxin MazE